MGTNGSISPTKSRIKSGYGGSNSQDFSTQKRMNESNLENDDSINNDSIDQDNNKKGNNKDIDLEEEQLCTINNNLKSYLSASTESTHFLTNHKILFINQDNMLMCLNSKTM